MMNERGIDGDRWSVCLPFSTNPQQKLPTFRNEKEKNGKIPIVVEAYNTKDNRQTDIQKIQPANKTEINKTTDNSGQRANV